MYKQTKLLRKPGEPDSSRRQRSEVLNSFAPLPEDLSPEELVPEDHIYRRLQARLDLSCVRDLVAPLFGEAKEWLGLRSFGFGPLERVNIGVLIIASGQNVKRIVAFGSGRPRKGARAAARIRSSRAL